MRRGFTSRRRRDGQILGIILPNDNPPVRPWLRAGVIAGVGITVLELISNLIPGIGFVIATPLEIIVYYFQGVMVARFIRRDARLALVKPVAQAALSGLVTSVVISIIFTFLTYTILVPVTLGGAILALPFSILNSLMDVVLNVVFASLGAWMAGRFEKKGFGIASLAVLGCAGAAACLLSVAVLAALAVLGIGAFKGMYHLPFLPTPTP